MQPRRGYNPKRKIAGIGTYADQDLAQFARAARYGGNPEHKKSPGAYNLTPPTSPRPGKTLCDAERPLLKGEAKGLLDAGFDRGLVSVQTVGGWPQNVWAVDEEGRVFEAQLENRETGTYHGYPMPTDDSFRNEVLREWDARAGRIDHTG